MRMNATRSVSGGGSVSAPNARAARAAGGCQPRRRDAVWCQAAPGRLTTSGKLRQRSSRARSMRSISPVSAAAPARGGTAALWAVRGAGSGATSGLTLSSLARDAGAANNSSPSETFAASPRTRSASHLKTKSDNRA